MPPSRLREYLQYHLEAEISGCQNVLAFSTLSTEEVHYHRGRLAALIMCKELMDDNEQAKSPEGGSNG